MGGGARPRPPSAIIAPPEPRTGSHVADSLLETATFVSFDGGVTERAPHQRPDRYRMIEGDRTDAPRIARGGGYSYTAASFGGGSRVVDMTRFDRVLRFDPATRLIEVEAG